MFGKAKTFAKDMKYFSSISTKIRRNINGHKKKSKLKLGQKWNNNYILTMFNKFKIIDDKENKIEQFRYLIFNSNCEILNSGIHSSHLFLNNEYFEQKIDLLNEAMKFIKTFRNDDLINENNNFNKLNKTINDFYYYREYL